MSTTEWIVGEPRGGAPCEIATFDGGKLHVIATVRKSEDAQLIVRAVNSHAEMLEALEHAAEIIKVARGYFPKSVNNHDRFDLENTNAAINKAIYRAKGGAA